MQALTIRTSAVLIAFVAIASSCADPVAPDSWSSDAGSQGPAGRSAKVPTAAVPMFVIGDVPVANIGDSVNFWGAQWWKHNGMSGDVSDGVASFKGYATDVAGLCGGTWSSRPGNSSTPPATLPNQVAVIVTTKVLKDGPNISGDIKQILIVEQDGAYGGNPGHDGNGVVRSIACPSDGGGGGVP